MTIPARGFLETREMKTDVFRHKVKLLVRPGRSSRTIQSSKARAKTNVIVVEEEALVLSHKDFVP